MGIACLGLTVSMLDGTKAQGQAIPTLSRDLALVEVMVDRFDLGAFDFKTVVTCVIDFF